MAIKHIFCRFLASLALFFVTANLFAAGYTNCSSKYYHSCNPKYYMTLEGAYDTSEKAGNACSYCPTGAEFCPGGTYAPAYKVTLNANGGSEGTTAAYRVQNSGWFSNLIQKTTAATSTSDIGTKISTITPPTKTGYTFKGYYTATSGGTQKLGPGGTIAAVSDAGGAETWYAQWTPNSFVITLNGNGAPYTPTTACTINNSKSSAYYVYDTMQFKCESGNSTTLTRLPVPSRTGYKFNGYYSAASGGKQITDASGALINKNFTTSAMTIYAQWTAISKTCSAGQYFNVTECADCTSGYYCSNIQKTYTYNGNIQGRINCPDGYNNSPAKATAQTQCYVTTTAGKYIANANDSTQTKCAENDYCTGSIKINYGKTGGNTKCPDPTTYAPTDLPSSDYSIKWNQYTSWSNTGLSDISKCGAIYGFDTAKGSVTYDGVKYDSATDKYALSNTTSIYWSSVTRGYYLETKHKEDYCTTTPSGNMLYQTVKTCPINNYCPGKDASKCSSGTYEDTYGKYACPTNSSTNGQTGQASCTCNTGYNYNDGTTTTTNACEANTYTIKYNSDGGSSVSNTKCTYGKSCTVSSEKPTKTGYTFAGWKYTSATYQLGATINNSLTSTNGAVLEFVAQWTPISMACLVGQYFNKTECADCTSGYYCPNGSKTYIYDGKIQGRSSCPTIYTKSDVKATAQTQCYYTTTAGNYIANAKDSAQTDCLTNNYCPSAKVYYGQTGSIAACPTPTANNAPEMPSDYKVVADTTIFTDWVNKNLKSIDECSARYTFDTNKGTISYENVKYISSTGKYSSDTSAIYWSSVKSGYYLKTRYQEDRCEQYPDRNMLYKTVETCPVNSYCPGGSVPVCNSGTYNDTFGVYACPANSSTNGKTGQASCTCNTGYNYNDGTTTASDACMANTYTIKYEKNGGSGTMTDQTCKYGKSCTLTANEFTKTGYKFNGWKNGENEYTNKESVSNLTTTNNGTVTLVAQWIPITFTVIYVANDGSGTQMDNTKCTYDSDCYITKNTYTKTGYIFKNWANPDKSRYFEDGENVKNARTTDTTLFLYAQWEPITYTIRYNANGGDGSMTDKQCVYDTDCKLDANTFTKTGHSFVGWLYGANIYQDQDNVPNLSTENGAVLEFIAQWSTDARKCDAGKYLNGDVCEICPVNYYCKGGTWDYNGEKQGLEKCPTNSSTNGATGQTDCACDSGYNYNNAYTTASEACNANTYTIKFDFNGGDESWALFSEKVCTYGTNCDISNRLTRTGYTFKHWLYNNQNFDKNANVKLPITENGKTVTFVAQWTPITYTVRYDKNGGSGSMKNTTCTYDEVCVLSENTYTKTGHHFDGWWYAGASKVTTVMNAAEWQDEEVVVQAIWLPDQIQCPAGQYLNGLDCNNCEDEYYCEGGKWLYDGGIHGRTDCPVQTETFGAAGIDFNVGIMEMFFSSEPATKKEECNMTYAFTPEWTLSEMSPENNLPPDYDAEINNRGMFFVRCKYNYNTKIYDLNCEGFPFSCGSGYISMSGKTLLDEDKIADISEVLYYARSLHDAFYNTCVPVGYNYWSSDMKTCLTTSDLEESLMCMIGKSGEKNACPYGGITLTDTAGAITDCLKNDVECATDLGDGIKTCSYDEATGGYDNCGECSVDSCKSGYYMNNGVCTTCPAGSACSDNNITTCGANTWSTVGGTQCNACPANSSTKGATGQTQCVCNDGYTTNGKFDGSTTTTTQACIKTDINVSYDVNGGVGRLDGHTCPAGADCTLLTPSDIGNQMYRAGYVFIGWGDNANATTPVNPVFNTDVTLYAIWNACAAGTYKTVDAALDAQCSLCADLDNSDMYPNTNTVASTSASACYMTCKDKTVSGGVAHPTDVNVYYPNVCEYKTGTSINGNTCEIVNDKCIEVSCNFDYEMIDGICHPCNRENATEYQKTGNCIVAKCRYGYHPNGQSCQSDTIECTAPNAVSASQKWDTKTGAYGICTVTKCDAGYHIVANACQPDEQTCELEHGIGWREWDEKKNDWGKCVATYCEPGYTNDPDLTNESWEQCGRCNNMYGTRGELVVSSYVQGCEIAACMHQGEHFILENNECRDICETYSDETGSRKWNGSRCVHTCNEGYTNW